MSIIIFENTPLSEHSTMRLGGPAKFLCFIKNEDELLEALEFAKQKTLKVRMIGQGSNIIWSDSGFDGLVIVNEIQDFEIKGEKVTIGAGFDWDKAVRLCVEANLSGIEFLSFIPGTAGATPVQNVGAYGAEIKDTLIELRAYDTELEEFVTLKNEQCGFSYRNSRFKSVDSGRFLITQTTLQLKKTNPKPPFYESLSSYLDENGIKNFTPQIIRDAVIAIRTNKLPDPFETANNGSFFANPVIENAYYVKLRLSYPDLKAWPTPDGRVKIAAGWLIEQAGFKDYHDAQTGMATWAKQALVLINENAKSTQDLLTFKQKIVDAVQAKFDITLEQEPELIA